MKALQKIIRRKPLNEIPKPPLWLFVLLPTVIVAVYLGFIATDRYRAETRFSIKQSSPSTPSEQRELPFLESTISTPAEDAGLIREHIHSAEMLRHLDQELDYSAHFQSASADPFSRLPEDASLQRRLAFLKRQVSVTIDPEYSIITLASTAFDPVMARASNDAILAASESFINRLNREILKRQITFLEERVNELAERMDAARREGGASEGYQRRLAETYESAVASLEGARTQAGRQMKFVIKVAGNGLPDTPAYPRVWRGIVTVFALALLVFFALRLIVATINDHRP